PQHSPEINHDFPELKDLRGKVDANTEDIIALENLAQVLKGKVIATRDRNLIFELIDTLVRILKVDPVNKYALIELANVSFESKAFPKAAEYYKKYLEIVPDDLEVRSRYASCLIFLDQHSTGLKELEIVLSKDPKNFSALAYKAIALSQTNQEAEAKKVGQLALNNAPDEEGRKRFMVFLDSLNGTTTKTKNALLDYLENNEITASKFQNLKKEGTVLILTFKDFPVALMPEFAKQKFTQNLREQTARVAEFQDVKTLIVRDQDTGEDLLTIQQQD
ncbi:MAG: hypothetical protein WD512_08245, partial [Candidatus Paceibacterota bacterium]